MAHVTSAAARRKIFIIVEPADQPGVFAAKIDGRLICQSRTPFCTSARLLIERGYAPGAILVMRHAGNSTDALTATIGAAARLTVEEGDREPRFRLWRPFQAGVVKAPMRPNGPAGVQGQPGSFSALVGSRSS
jgi:hypothetical protein